MSKQTDQLNVRISSDLLEDLKAIGRYEGVKVPELVRSWIRDRIREYRKDKRFEEWKAKNLGEEG